MSTLLGLTKLLAEGRKIAAESQSNPQNVYQDCVWGGKALESRKVLYKRDIEKGNHVHGQLTVSNKSLSCKLSSDQKLVVN